MLEKCLSNALAFKVCRVMADYKLRLALEFAWQTGGCVIDGRYLLALVSSPSGA